MQGFLIKYTEDCPHPDLRNTYLQRNQGRNVHEFSIFDSLQSAKRALRRLRWRKYAVVIEVDLKPITMFVPTEEWFEKSSNYNRKAYLSKKEKGKLEKYGDFSQYRPYRAYRPEDLNAKDK